MRIMQGVVTAMWKQLIFTAACCGGALSAQAAPFPVHDLDALGMGGVGVATANSYASFMNPALLASEKRVGKRFNVHLPLALIEDDPDNLKSTLDDFQRAAKTNDTAQFAPLLTRMEGKELTLDYFGGMAATLRDAAGNMRVFLSSYSLTTARMNIDPADKTTGAPGSFASTANVQGVSLFEIGMAYADIVDLGERDNIFTSGRLLVGVAPKVIVGKSHDETYNIEEADLSGFYGEGKTSNKLNLDLGVAKEWGRFWTLGLTAKNLIPHTFRTDTGKEYKLGGQLRLGGARHGRFYTAAFDVDVIPNSALGLIPRSQQLGVGLEFEIGRTLRLRGGYGIDLQGNLPDNYAVGLGLVSEYLHFNLAGLGNENGFTGLAMQMSVGF
ncbi:MAG: conjugal transfer protein TraF [Pseudomonadota bacterium]